MIMTVKKRKKKAATLGQRIANESAPPTEVANEAGPMGNSDFVAFGSEEHSALLGFDESGETIYDTVGVNPQHLERFLAQRKRWLETAPPPLPEGCPPMWDPDDYEEVTEVGL